MQIEHHNISEKCKNLCSYIKSHSFAFAQLGITTLWLSGSLAGHDIGLMAEDRVTLPLGPKKQDKRCIGISWLSTDPIATKQRASLWLQRFPTQETNSKKQSKVQHAEAHKHHWDNSLLQRNTRTISFSTVLHWHGFQFQHLTIPDSPGVSKLCS